MESLVQASLPTMLLMILVVSGAMALAVLFVAWDQSARDGLAWWGWGLLLNTTAFALFGVVHASTQSWLLVPGNVLQSAALAAALHSVVQYQRGMLGRGWLWGPVLAVALLSLAFVHLTRWRLLGVEFVFAGQTVLLVWVAVKASQRQQSSAIERGRLLLAGGAVLLALVYVQRLAMVLTGGIASVALVPAGGAQTLSYMAGLVGILFSTLGYVLMHKERAEGMYRRLAHEDDLTGIANRRAIMDVLHRALSQAGRSRRPVSVLMLDIDFFKHVNDDHGHLVGDLVLRDVAQRIQRRLRTQDVVGRYGGEEFLVVLPDTEVGGAMVLAEDLRVQFERVPVVCQGKTIAITMSIGVHGRVPDADPGVADAMLDAADRALYGAKQSGRNQVAVE